MLWECCPFIQAEAESIEEPTDESFMGQSCQWLISHPAMFIDVNFIIWPRLTLKEHWEV